MFPWAHYRTHKGGVKISVAVDYEYDIPLYLTVTDAKTHDRVAAKCFDFPKYCTIVFDRGYVDLKLFHELQHKKQFFVTRIKDNMLYEVKKNLAIPDSSDNEEPEKYLDIPRPYRKELLKKSEKRESFHLIKDEKIKFSSKQARKDYPHTLRLVTIYIPGKKKYMKFITNRFNLSAKFVAMLYQERWAVESFFKALKQNLAIKSFLGTSENAVNIQIYSAMIAIILLKYLQMQTTNPDEAWNFSNLVQLLRINLFSFSDLSEWIAVPHYKRKPRDSIKKPNPQKAIEVNPYFERSSLSFSDDSLGLEIDTRVVRGSI
jgi:transposase